MKNINFSCKWRNLPGYFETMLSYKYIPEENEKNLKEHKYSGKDMSILYNYAISPFAEWCLK